MFSLEINYKIYLISYLKLNEKNIFYTTYYFVFKFSKQYNCKRNYKYSMGKKCFKRQKTQKI